VCAALIGLALFLDFLTGEVIPAGRPVARPGPALAVLTGVLSLAFPMVGTLIASRLPNNPIGWIFSGMGLLYVGQRFTGAYADYALVENIAFPGGEYVAWLSSCVWFASLTLGVFLILLFPHGRLPSHRWRLVAWAAFFGAALATLGTALMPDYLIVTHPYVENPFEVVGVIGRFSTYEVFGASRFVGMMLLLASSLAALFSVILRLHHTRGIERQQIKWFLFAAVPLTVFLGLMEFELLIVNLTYDFYLRFDFLFNNGTSIFPSWEAFSAVQFVAVFSLLFIPVFNLHRYSQVSPLRHRCSHKPHPRLWLSHRHAGHALLRRHRGVAEGVRRPHGREVYPRCGSIRPPDRGPVQPAEASHPVLHRSPLLQAQVRREKDPRGLLSQAQR
jgi:hypothetical protein